VLSRSDHHGNQEFIFMMADPTSPTSPATDVRERVYLVVMPTKHQSRDLILKTLGTSDSTEVDLKDLAHRIEEEIFKANNNSTDNTYRNSIRTHVLNLKVLIASDVI
jgi:Transcription factor S-II (TFIIS), central domain